MHEITKNEARWLEETGIELANCRRIAGTLSIFHHCGRCGGQGYIQPFGHVENGRCFECGGARGRWVSVQGVAARRRAAERKQTRWVQERRDAVRRAAREARHFLATHEGLAKALTLDLGFVRSIAQQLANRGGLTEKQVAAVFRAHEAVIARPDPVELQAGRQELVGTIIRIKLVESPYGLSEKMLVELQPGARVFGTMPRSLDAEPGARVRFTATVDPREPGFGFFSRPTKAEVVPAIELDCGHAECAQRYAEEIRRVGEDRAEALCIPAERAEEAAYYAADAAATRREG